MVNADQEIVKRALAVLFRPGETIELRCLAGERIINGYYRDQAKLAQDACTLNTDFSPQQNCFVVLNPVDPQLYARRADQFGQAKKGDGTKDPEVVCRRWLLIDCDPIRPTGVSATEPQRAAAIKLAKAVHKYLLEDLHFPQPVCCDSGNGQHMLLPLANLPNDAASQWACERFLTHLAERFQGKECKVDTTTYNAARITALYGTCKRKGSDIAEAPHRLSFLRAVPDPIVPVSLEQLLAVVGPYPGDQHQAAQAAPQQAGSAGWNIPQLLVDHQAEYEQDENYQTASGERATRYTLEVCPFNENHNDRSAVLIQWQAGAVAFKCHHDGCTGKDWQALKSLWGLPAADGITTADIILPTPQAIVQPARELLLVRSLDVQAESVEWLWWQRLVIGGINLFAGRGGIGKSYYLCDLTARITNDGLLSPTGDPLKHGRVLYASGEDHIAKVAEPRMQQHGVNRARLEYIKGLPSGPYVELLDVIGHLDLLRDAVRSRPDTVALVLDPISSFSALVDSNKVNSVRRFTSALTQLAEEYNIAILGIHHFNKGRRDVAGDQISGSHAYRDAARAIWLFALDAKDPSRRLMVSDKNNWAAERPLGLAYRITAGRIEYEAAPVELTSDELLSQGVQDSLAIACSWLTAQLSAGPRSAVDLQIAATASNIKERTLHRAKDQLGVQSAKEGSHWMWRLA